MRIEREVAIPMSDDVTLRCDVFRPSDDGVPCPAIVNLGPYGKGVRYQDFYREEWDWLVGHHPEVLAKSTGRYAVWETVDPDVWVPAGYACVRVDSRGAGRSPGTLDCFSPREVRDLYEAIEWVATQAWCSGMVGLCGISYYAINQWLVAGLEPPHLAAMIPWEGCSDLYREWAYHGGILSNHFTQVWFPAQVETLQHGREEGAPTDPWLDERATGPESLPQTELDRLRVDLLGGMRSHPLDDEYFRGRSADFEKVTVPLLSSGNWGGIGLHARGNFEGFTESASRQKWLEVHVGRHDEWFNLPYGQQLQRRFFDHFLMGQDNGWDNEPRVQLHIRHADGSVVRRSEDQWPLTRTMWSKLYLQAAAGRLDWDGPGADADVGFAALSTDVRLRTAPLERSIEVTGPVAARLFVASSTSDADLFLTLRAFTSDGVEVAFQGANDPRTPLTQGWLRASHRRLDPVRSRPYRPYHSHRQPEPLEVGAVYELAIELWPTCIVLPEGAVFEVVVAGRDFRREETKPDPVWVMQGSGPFTHDDPHDRPASIFGGTTTLYTGSAHPSCLVLPVIP